MTHPVTYSMDASAKAKMEAHDAEIAEHNRMAREARFNRQNLVEFETLFFANRSQFPLWYGQALNQRFDYDDKFGDSLNQEPSDEYARTIAWLKIAELEAN